MVLVALWGTSFMFNAISVRSVDPVSVVFYRLALGAVVLSLVVYARGDYHNISAFRAMSVPSFLTPVVSLI